MAEAEWEDAPVSTGEDMKEIVATAEVLNGGAPQVPVVQRRTAFQTAVAVIKPRNLKLVEQEIMLESESAGEEFFYSIPFKKKDGSIENVRDGSIDLAYAFMRAMGNCGITSDVNDVVAPDGHHWEFTSTFIDLEKGANYERTIRRKAGAGVLAGLAKKDPQRVYDMRFGAAQSISHRNAIKAGVPGWLWKRAVNKAIDAATAAIRKETPAVAIEKAVKHFAGMGVTLEMIEKALGRTKDAWETDDILKLRGYATAIKDGQTSAEGIFGKPPAPEPEKPEAPVGVETTDVSKPPPEAEKNAQNGVGAEKPEVSAADLDNHPGSGANGPSAPPETPQRPDLGGPTTPPSEKPTPGITFPDLMESLKKNPGLQFTENTAVKTQQGAVIAKIRNVEWGDDGACFVKLKFAPNLSELAGGLTKEQVINSFKSAGIAIEDEDADVLTPPPATEKKKRGGRPTAAEVREECRTLMAEKGISWETASRFFPGESLDVLPDAKLAGLLAWVKSQA